MSCGVSFFRFGSCSERYCWALDPDVVHPWFTAAAHTCMCLSRNAVPNPFGHQLPNSARRRNTPSYVTASMI